jgi:DNA-binding protein H-NS
MPKSYSELKQQIEALQAEAARIRSQEVEEVISGIKKAIQSYGLTAADLGFLSGRPGRPGRAAARVDHQNNNSHSSEAKYRNAAGQTWGGRGPRPRWLRQALADGKSLADFTV